MTESGSVRTAIIEDHPLFRDALAAVVESMPALELGSVIEDTTDVTRVVDNLAAEGPGVVLVDYSLDGSIAPELIAMIVARCPSTRCLVLSGHLNAEYAQRSLAAGASGYVLKGRPDDLEDAIAAILVGGTYVSASVSRERPQD